MAKWRRQTSEMKAAESDEMVAKRDGESCRRRRLSKIE
jgi:hypothetical protein